MSENQLPIDIVIRPLNPGDIEKAIPYSQIVQRFNQAGKEGAKQFIVGLKTTDADIPFGAYDRFVEKARKSARQSADVFKTNFKTPIERTLDEVDRRFAESAERSKKIFADLDRNFKAQVAKLSAAPSTRKFPTEDQYAKLWSKADELMYAPQDAHIKAFQDQRKIINKLHADALRDDREFNRQQAAEARRAASETYNASYEKKFKTAGIATPEARQEKREALEIVRLHTEMNKGTMDAKDYKRIMTQVNEELKILEKGSANARNAFHRLTAQMASFAFEITGALYGIAAIGTAFAAPAIAGIKFSKTIEDATLGMSGILVSMGELGGKALTFQQAMSAAGMVARDMAANSLKYAVPLEDLIETTRAVMASGLGAGMSIKEIEKIATIGTIAVKSIGLDSKQVVQEVRDLVAGGIQSASSTLATALGIRDSDIKAAKQSAGGLYDFLLKRLDGFTMAALERENTLGGAWDLLKLKVTRLFSDDEGFNILKKALIDISNYIAVIDQETGQLKFNEEVIAMVRSYWNGLKAVFEALKLVAQATAAILPTAMQVGAAFVTWFGVRKLVGVFTEVSTAIGAMSRQAAAAGVASAASVGGSVSAWSKAKGTFEALSQRGGLIGLALFGSFEVLNYTGWMDKIFSTLNSRVKDATSQFQTMPEDQLRKSLEQDQATYKSITASSSLVAKGEDGSNAYLPQWDINGVKLYRQAALETLASIMTAKQKHLAQLEKERELQNIRGNTIGSKAEAELTDQASKVGAPTVKRQEMQAQIEAADRNLKAALESLDAKKSAAASKASPIGDIRQLEEAKKRLELGKSSMDAKAYALSLNQVNEQIANLKNSGNKDVTELTKRQSELRKIHAETLAGIYRQFEDKQAKGSKANPFAQFMTDLAQKKRDLFERENTEVSLPVMKHDFLKMFEDAQTRGTFKGKSKQFIDDLRAEMEALDGRDYQERWLEFNEKHNTALKLQREFQVDINSLLQEQLELETRQPVKKNINLVKVADEAVAGTLRGAPDDIAGAISLADTKDQLIFINELLAYNRDINKDIGKQILEISQAQEDYTRAIEAENLERANSLKYIGMSAVEVDLDKEHLRLISEIADITDKYRKARVKNEAQGVDSSGLDAAYVADVNKAQEAYDRVRQSVIDTAHESRKWSTGSARAFNEFRDKATNAAEYSYQIWSTTFSEMSGALTSLVTTGKADFADMTRSILANIVQMKIEMAMMSAIDLFGKAFGGAVGGGVSPTSYTAANGVPVTDLSTTLLNANGNMFNGGNVIPFAKGGAFTNSIVNTPTIFPMAKGAGLMGEAGPEAVMPLERTSTGELGVRATLHNTAASSGGNVYVEVEVNIDQSGNADTTVNGQGFGESMGKAIGNIVKQTVRQELINQKRTNGLLTK